MAIKELGKGILTNIYVLEEPCPICILNKATIINIVYNIDVSRFLPGFMLQLYFAFSNVERICVFKSDFVAICYATSHPFGFPSRSQRPSLDIFKFLVSTLNNQNKKDTFIWVDEYGSLARYSDFMWKCHNMNIIVQTTVGDASSLNGKSVIPNNTPAIYNNRYST